MIQDMLAPPAVNPDSLLFKARFQPGELLTSAAVAVKQAVDVGLAAIDCMYGPVEAAIQKQQLQQALAEDAAATARAASLQQASATSKVSSATAELNAAASAVSAAVDLNAAASAPSGSASSSSALAGNSTAELGAIAAASAASAAGIAAASAARAVAELQQLQQQQQTSHPAGSAAAAAMQLQDAASSAAAGDDTICSTDPGGGRSIAEQGQLAQQQHELRLQQLQLQPNQNSNDRQARFELAADRLRGSWVASMVHLNKQREETAQKLLQQSSEARHAFNQSAHEMYNEVAPPLLAHVVHLIGDRNAADLVAFLGRSNTATVVGKLGSGSNVARLSASLDQAAT
jgi:hypothetical protein